MSSYPIEEMIIDRAVELWKRLLVAPVYETGDYSDSLYRT